MFNKIGIKLVKFLLKRDLTVDQRNQIVVHILASLDALPIYGIISLSGDGEILINNRSLDVEKLKQLREAASVALDNKALKLLNDEVAFTAVTMGVHQVEQPLQMLFARAAIWYGQQQQKQLTLLAQRQTEQELVL